MFSDIGGSFKENTNAELAQINYLQISLKFQLVLHNFLNPIKQVTAGFSEPLAPIPLAKWPQAGH